MCIRDSRRDCPNADPARRSPNEKGRWIKVSWADDVEGTFRTTLRNIIGELELDQSLTSRDTINLSLIHI